jgi:hypothetical protein
MAYLFAALLIAAPLALHLRGLGAAIYGLTAGVIAVLLFIPAAADLICLPD